MKKIKFLLPLVLVVFTTQTIFGNIKLPSILGDNMVLQQKSEVQLWGSAAKNTIVSIQTSWDGKQHQVKSAADGSWRVKVQTPSAGGPYTISFDDGKPLQLKNILIGEVWVCSGQSNMEIPLKGFNNQPILHSNDIIANAGNTNFRLFHIPRTVSNTPLADCPGNWEVSSPGSAITFSAVGFQFGQMLQKILNVPVGMIESSWGGTPIEAWMNAKSLESFPEILDSLKMKSKPDRLKPTCLFNAMISPITGYGIKGFLWYQGERNTLSPTNYAKKMYEMVNAWRKLWGNDSLSFYFVQIAPWKYRSHRDSVPYLREQQQKAAQEIPHSGMVVSVDKGDEFTVHAPDKTTISKRLLYWALGDAYHQKGISYKSPVFESMKVQGDSILLTFNNAPLGFTSHHNKIDGFEVAGADKVFYPATAKIYKKVILLKCNQVTDPVSVRYAFTDWVVGDLYNTAGLPVAPFRTDQW